jgi:predicted NodU family carbamoyl transferase
MTTALALTLGHNSSAVLIVDGQVICGYEQERFSTVKSDSHFPTDAINEINKRFPLPSDTSVCVGHWFLDHDLPKPNKYWDPDFLVKLMPHCEVLSLDREFSHHDSHLESAVVFAGDDFANTYTAIVADGFGSSGECISVYEVHRGSYRLLNRWFGFEKSLGLLYQYATAFLGMKMHNHEYKMLAYEVHLHKLGYNVLKLNSIVLDTAKVWVDNIFHSKIDKETDPLLMATALTETQARIDVLLQRVLIEMDASGASVHDKRCIISYFVQHVVEEVMVTIFHNFAPTNLLLVGGLFYNVKLNSILAKLTPEKTCIMPLAGDQGCGLGVYQRYFGDLEWPEHLFWGHRDLNFACDDIQMVSFEDLDTAMGPIVDELSEIGFVNIVRGAMEFGPRALCNTTTLALPYSSIGETINEINDRTNEMPFALVMSAEQAVDLFIDVSKIHKSLGYMICTRDFRPGKESDLFGGAHYYPDLRVHTCRPQITDDPHLLALVNAFGPLINTSYNFHGVPIVLGESQIKGTHTKQRAVAPGRDFRTFIIRN